MSPLEQTHSGILWMNEEKYGVVIEISPGKTSFEGKAGKEWAIIGLYKEGKDDLLRSWIRPEILQLCKTALHVEHVDFFKPINSAFNQFVSIFERGLETKQVLCELFLGHRKLQWDYSGT